MKRSAKGGLGKGLDALLPDSLLGDPDAGREIPIDEISAIMGCKESTVRQHLFRATHKLQDELSDLAEKFGLSSTAKDSG